MSGEQPQPELPVRRPQEQVAVTMFDLPCLAVRDSDGSIYVSLADLCTALGLNRASQLRRIRSHTLLQQGLARFLIRQGNTPQVIDCLQIQIASNWLLTISVARVAEPVRDRLTYLQIHLFAAVWEAFAQLSGLPPGPSRNIEDLDDLQQIDRALLALEQLARRQQTIEESQDRARTAWRDLNEQIRTLSTRVGELEQKIGGTISKGQRGHLYQLVQAWAEARTTRSQQLGRREVYAATWAEFKARFRLARYEDLPLGSYAEAVGYVREKYQQLTGTPLSLPEQADLPLE